MQTDIMSWFHLHRITVNDFVTAIARSRILVITGRMILRIRVIIIVFVHDVPPGAMRRPQDSLTSLKSQLCHGQSKQAPTFGWMDAIASERTSSEEHIMRILSLSNTPWS